MDISLIIDYQIKLAIQPRVDQQRHFWTNVPSKGRPSDGNTANMCTHSRDEVWLQDIIFRSPACELSVYRLMLSRDWHVAVLGLPPAETLE